MALFPNLRRVAEKRLLGGHHTMPEPLGAAPSVNSAITAQKLNENQLKYLIRGTSVHRYMYRMYTRGGAAPARAACMRRGSACRPACARAAAASFRIIGILTGPEDSRIEFMQNSEF